MAANVIAVAEMMTRLTQGPASIAQVAEHAGVHVQTARDYIQALHRRKTIRIAQWFKGAARNWQPMYEWNQDGLPDVPKPKPLTRTEVQRRYKARKHQKALTHIGVTTHEQPDSNCHAGT